MRWDNPGLVESVVWDLREGDLPRAENRTILNRLYNGEPPFDPAKAEENNIEINLNDLEGVNLLSQARRQWNSAMLKPGNKFSVLLDSGPVHKREEWAHSITKHLNRQLKKSRKYMEQNRAVGANVMLHGPGPANWPDRRNPIPVPIHIASLLIPSETDLDFENLEYFAVFREWTPSMLYKMTHGPKVDPGWNLPLVEANLRYIADQTQKQPNATAYQYMPERIEELIKQDMGFWGSDAVPTVDVWDFYFRQSDEGKGWYRRIIPDWGAGTEGATSEVYRPLPKRQWGSKELFDKFLYTSGHRKYANSLSEILHCQFGDCSAVAPFKYHSVRSLGWMLWGVCDLQNRLHCKFNEAVFESLMWFFRTASNADLVRLRKANFTHLGIIPQGINFVPAGERFIPNPQLVTLAFARNRQLMSENAASFTQDFDKGETGKEMTATETMARVNSVNALVSGMLSLAYTYEEFKDREICRRFCIKNNPHRMVQDFRLAVLQEGVPEEFINAERWNIERERVLGAGNKTLEMATVQFLQGIRKNLPAEGQRRVDHLSIEAATDQADLAEQLAPVADEKPVTNSQHDAQLAVDRLLRGLPYQPPRNAIPEDYVAVWLRDLANLIGGAVQGGNLATAEELTGLGNLAFHITQMLDAMEADDENVPRAKAYRTELGKLENLIKGFAQRLQEQMRARAAGGNGRSGLDPKDAAKIQATLIAARAKAQAGLERSAQRMAMDQARFEREEQQAERSHAANLRRQEAEAGHDMLQRNLTALTAPGQERPGAFGE